MALSKSNKKASSGQKKKDVEENESDDGNFDDMIDDDYDSEGSDSGVGDDLSPESASKKRKHSEGHGLAPKKKVKRPTAEEAIQLRETESLFQSNLFRLQIEEMMKEIKPKQTSLAALPPWIDKLKRFLMGLKEMEDLSLKKYKWLWKLGVRLPIPPSKNEHKGDFNFLPPLDLLTVGSVRAGCPQGPHFSVDLAVVMPRKIFQRDDALNQRYHLKRALYLSVIAARLKESEFVTPGSLKFSTMNGDPLKPVLVFVPNAPGKISKKTEVVIFAVPQEDTFKRVRFYPEKNNLRPAWFGLEETEGTLPATPHYNMSVAEDVVMETNDTLRSEMIEGHNSVREAVSLLRVWLTQRQLNQGYGAFTTFIMSMYVIYLMKIQKINHHMSSYQILRNVWLSLSTTDWTTDGPSMVSSALLKVIPLSVFHEHFDVVFVDSTGLCNLTARMNKYTYWKVKREAELAIQYLDNKGINSFQTLFMNKLSFIREFDHIISFSNPAVLSRVVSKFGAKYEIHDLNGFSVALFIRILAPILSRGLGERVDQINFSLMKHRRWSLDEEIASSSFDSAFMIGLKLNPEHALNLINKGPEANLPEASEFRSFWGERSELRRFQDGRVCESAVWGEDKISIAERRLIVSKIVHYLFESKFEITPSEYSYIADNLAPVIMNKISPGDRIEESCLAINRVLQELSSQMRDLEDLPLSVVSVRSLSAAFRFTDVFPPLPGRLPISLTLKACQRPKDSGHPARSFLRLKEENIHSIPPYVPPIDLVVQLESTRKWPNDIGACKRLLASFHVAIASALKKKNNVQSVVTRDYIVVYKNGYAFRLFLANTKEIALLKERITPEGVLQYRDTPESIELERKFINLPKISGALHGLSQLYPAFGSTAALAKRWLSAQLLDDWHFPQVVVELLVARLFLEPYPLQPPQQPQVAFLRFLDVLATTNWYVEPVIINFNGLLTRDQVTEIEKHFTSQRACLPAMFVATPYDTSGRLWTQKAPTLANLVRLAKLASLTLRLIENYLVSSQPVDKLLDAFRPPMSVYDCVIVLNQYLCPRSCERIDWKSGKGSKLYPVIEQPVIGFDPVQCYLNELRENYGDYALFFHDSYGGSVIGVLFKPTVLENKEFKVSNMAGRKPTTKGGTTSLELNMSAIIDDFCILGDGLVSRVDNKMANKT